jgi:hypothetical protein
MFFKRYNKHLILAKSYLRCILSRETTNANSIVFGLTRLFIEHTIFQTWVKHATHFIEHTIFQTWVKHATHFTPLMQSTYFYLYHTCEPSGGSIFLPILRVPSVPPVNFQNLPPVKKLKYKQILTCILRSIFLEIPNLELPRWRKTPRDTNGKGECLIYWYPVINLFDTFTGKLGHD